AGRGSQAEAEAGTAASCAAAASHSQRAGSDQPSFERGGARRLDPRGGAAARSAAPPRGRVMADGKRDPRADAVIAANARAVADSVVREFRSQTRVTRVRFEVRVLGGAKAERFHCEDLVEELPRVGDLAGPLLFGRPTRTRRVIAIEKAPEQWNVAAVVKLEDIDCSRLNRDFETEVYELLHARWTR